MRFLKNGRVWLLAVLVFPAGSLFAAMPPVPVPASNLITESKRVLGKILFWDEQLSSDDSIACGTCHIPNRGTGDPRVGVHPGLDGLFGTLDDAFGSPGVVRRDENIDPVFDAFFGWSPQVTPRSAQPTLGGVPYAASLFWDGRATGQFVDPQDGAVVIPAGGAMESQALGPILSDVEMAHEGRTWDQVIAKLGSVTPLALSRNNPPDMSGAVAANPTYPGLFAAAFGTPAISARRIAFAIATYERTLIPDQTPWDRFTEGDTSAMTPGQVQGWNFFNNSPVTCRICHTPPIFSNNTFRNIGLRPWQEDTGRFETTGVFADRGRFKVPSLRNAGLKETFMHNGRLSSLDQVLDFYIGINGQQQFPQNQDPLIPPIFIPPPVRPALVDFLANGLTDPRVANEEFPFDRPWLLSELGDGDRDGDVDVFDYARFLDCIDAPGTPAVESECLLFDFDGDGGVDFADFVGFQRRVTGL